MAKTALCIGINDYLGTANDLSGCINDTQDWANTPQARDLTVASLLDSAATKAGMVAAMRRLIGQAQAGDSVILTYFGHGTWVPDTSGDEPDSRDETLCPYDINSANALIDDEIHHLAWTFQDQGDMAETAPQETAPEAKRRSSHRTALSLVLIRCLSSTRCQDGCAEENHCINPTSLGTADAHARLISDQAAA